MPGGRKQILSPFTGRKKQKAWNKTRKKKYAGKKKTKFSWNRPRIILQRGTVRRIFSKGACNNGNESDNDENNEQQQLPEGFYQ